jgi:2-(1,2-epoxy-1,2-dihydrophenyl)acetyl-CoA isomerase
VAAGAVFRQAYTSSGLCIDGGGTFSLPRLVGHARALEIAAFDEPIPADRAAAWGLATKVVGDGAAVEEAMAMARDLAGRSVHSFGLSKRLLLETFNTSLETQLERERDGLCRCSLHADGQEGVRAFVEKRRPVTS